MSHSSREDIAGFIELYKKNKCLWDSRSEEYRNRTLKDRGYAEMVAYSKRLEPEANRDFVMRKINSLRSSFRKELKRVRRSEKFCGESGIVYEPKLWYYKLLSFLLVVEGSKRLSDGVNNMDDAESVLEQDIKVYDSPRSPLTSMEDKIGAENGMSPHSESGFGLDSMVEEDQDSEPLLESSVPHPMSFPSSSAPQKSSFEIHLPQKRKKSQDESRQRQHSPVKLKEDQFDVYGKHIANRFRQLTPEQRIHAEKIISDVLYEAELNTLSRNSLLMAEGPTPYAGKIISISGSSSSSTDVVSYPS